MAAIESDSKISLHVRSHSLPSAPHPLVSQFEEHLKRLKSSKSATTSSSSLCHKLSGLQDLHECTDKLLQLNITQQVLAPEFSQKWADELLDRSLRLLDICSTAKDCLLQSKGCVHEIQSAIRRRIGYKTVEAGKYLASRKNMKKEIQKVFGNVKEIRNGFNFSSTNNMLSLLKEAEEVTVTTLESLLYFISEPKGQLKETRWPTIYKLIQPKRVACESQELETNEFQKVDAALKPLNKHKPTSSNNFQGQLESLEMCILDLELGVECLSRQLIKTRVSLLNVFNH